MKKIFALLFPSMSAGFMGIGPSKLTVDSALAQFNSVLADLRKVKAAQDAEEEKQAQAAVDAEQRKQAIIDKAERDAAAAIAAADEAGEKAAREARRAAIAIAKIEAFVA